MSGTEVSKASQDHPAFVGTISARIWVFRDKVIGESSRVGELSYEIGSHLKVSEVNRAKVTDRVIYRPCFEVLFGHSPSAMKMVKRREHEAKNSKKGHQ